MYDYHTLPNGMKIILRHTLSPVVHSGVFINVGSRDEHGPDEGMAHFIEHSLFKGTTHRRAHHILNRIDGVGGELNAFTTKEETCVYATSLAQHLPRCLDLFADILFHSVFPEPEIEKEKEVVIEEINSYKDSPAELIYDQFEELAFVGHPLAHNILGSPRLVRRFSSQRLRQHLEQCYTPSRMVVSVVGNVEFPRLVKLCERCFGSFPNHPSAVDRSAKPSFARFDRHIHRHTHQAHLLLGCKAPDVFSPDKTAFTLLNNILGGPAMNSRLNIAVRERHGFCYTVESQYVPLSDVGLFYVYAGVDSDAQCLALDIIRRELERIATSPLSDRQLRQAQQQFIGQMAINNDNGLNEMQSIGKAFLLFDRVDTLDEMNADILRLSPADLQRVARSVLAPDSFSTLIYG